MVEEKKEEVEAGPSLSTLLFVAGVCVTILVGFAVYNMVTGPYAVADDLRDHVDRINCSDDYRQGWLDCVDYWLEQTVGPANCTTAMVIE